MGGVRFRERVMNALQISAITKELLYILAVDKTRDEYPREATEKFEIRETTT